jgi:hypothetical protein
MRPKGSADELERRRRHAMALCDQGLKPAAAARAVGVSRASVTGGGGLMRGPAHRA